MRRFEVLSRKCGGAAKIESVRAQAGAELGQRSLLRRQRPLIALSDSFFLTSSSHSQLAPSRLACRC